MKKREEVSPENVSVEKKKISAIQRRSGSL
jgi:hypothetical protein